MVGLKSITSMGQLPTGMFEVSDDLANVPFKKFCSRTYGTQTCHCMWQAMGPWCQLGQGHGVAQGQPSWNMQHLDAGVSTCDMPCHGDMTEPTPHDVNWVRGTVRGHNLNCQSWPIDTAQGKHVQVQNMVCSSTRHLNLEVRPLFPGGVQTPHKNEWCHSCKL